MVVNSKKKKKKRRILTEPHRKTTDLNSQSVLYGSACPPGTSASGPKDASSQEPFEEKKQGERWNVSAE